LANHPELFYICSTMVSCPLWSEIRPARSSGQRPMLFQPDPWSYIGWSRACVHLSPVAG